MEYIFDFLKEFFICLLYFSLFSNSLKKLLHYMFSEITFE